jgi:hypothetical protein
MKFFTKVVTLAVFLSAPAAQGFGSATLYRYPEQCASSEAYEVRVNGERSFVLPVPQTNQRAVGFLDPFTPHIVSFGITGRVTIDVTPRATVQRVKIRPERAGIAHSLRGNTITLTLDRPQRLSVELNGDAENPLLIFADEPETEIPDRNDPNVLFYEGGKVHYAGQITLASNQTVYIASGAICYGAFATPPQRAAVNLRIMGRGVLSGALDTTPTGGKWPIILRRVTGATVEGVTLTDCKDWSIALQSCDNVAIKGVKIVSNTGFDDGVDVVGSRNVTIEDCFIRTKDDCIALKAGVDYSWSGGGLGEGRVENVAVRRCVIWNGKHGNGLEIGFELLTDTVRNVTFEDIDLIHTENPGGMDEGAITIHNSGTAVVDNILYKNIRIEDPQRVLFQFSVLKSEYTNPNKYGKIQNIRLEDVTVSTPRSPPFSIAGGLDASAGVRNVTFKNLLIDGEKITEVSRDAGGKFFVATNPYSSSFTFE